MDTRFKPTIPGTRLLLRPYTPRDAEALYSATQEPESLRLTGTHADFTRQQIERWCESVATAEERVDLVMESRANGDYLGEVVLNDIDVANRSASFRIALAGPHLFGRGYGSEAARLMLDYGFGNLELNRVYLEVYTLNTRAIRLYESLGFKSEGRLREALLQDGRYHDALVMGMLRQEYLTND